MKPFSKLNCLGLAFAGILATSCTEQPTAVADYQIVPMPLEMTTPQQNGFLLKSGETIYYTAGNEKMKKNAEFLASFIKEQTGIDLKVQEGDKESGIVLKLGLEANSPEAYRMTVDGKKVVITAPSEAGVFMAFRRCVSRFLYTKEVERLNCLPWKSTTVRVSAIVV